MSTGMLIYLITRMDVLRSETFLAGVILVGVALIISSIHWAVMNGSDSSEREKTEEMELWTKYRRRIIAAFYIGVFVLVANILLPSTKELALIVGLDKLSSSPQVNDVLNQLYQTIMHLLRSAG